MKWRTILCGVAIAAVLQLGALACSAQTTNYMYTGSETNVTLNPGTYIITAYGAAGGLGHNPVGGLGAEMSAEFNFSSPTDLTLLVGNVGSLGGANNSQTYINAGGGGGGSFVVEGSTPLVVAGGGGGGAANGDLTADGGNASITPGGSTGGGNDGGSGGTGGSGGNGGGYLLYGGGVPLDASGAGGGGGINTDGGYGNATYDGAYPIGGSSFEDGGAGGTGAGGDGLEVAEGGFGGGGGGYSDADHAYGGGGGGYSGGGGGGDDLPSDYFGAGGGGGSFIDSSAIAILAEVSGINSPDRPGRGEIIITALPEPASAGLLAIGSLALLARRRRRHDFSCAKISPAQSIRRSAHSIR
jgi:Glycine rich protein